MPVKSNTIEKYSGKKSDYDNIKWEKKGTKPCVPYGQHFI